MRALRGHTQTDLSHLTGIDQRNITLYEKGGLSPRPETLDKLEAALDVRFNAPEVDAAFAVLSSNAARADEVKVALAVLEGKNGRG